VVLAQADEARERASEKEVWRSLLYSVNVTNLGGAPGAHTRDREFWIISIFPIRESAGCPTHPRFSDEWVLERERCL
jgi:hypothetical protein